MGKQNLKNNLLLKSVFVDCWHSKASFQLL